MIGLDLAQLMQAGTALVGVLGLLLVGAAALRLFRRQGGRTIPNGLRVTESVMLDPRHRLVRVADGERMHLIVLGPAGAVHIDRRDGAAATAGDDR